MLQTYFNRAEKHCDTEDDEKDNIQGKKLIKPGIRKRRIGATPNSQVIAIVYTKVKTYNMKTISSCTIQRKEKSLCSMETLEQ